MRNVYVSCTLMANQTGQQLIQKAGKYHSAGKYIQAEKIYRRLLKANPNDLTLIRLLGMLERDRHNPKGAVHWFSLAKQLSSNDPIILAELALTLEQAGKSENAMEIALEAQAASPTDISIAIFFAKMCLTRGEASRGAVALEQAIETDPKNPEAWLLLAISANSSGILPVPLHFAQKAIQLDTNSAPPHSVLASSHRLNGNLDSSLTCYERALSIDSMLAEAIAGKAEVLESLGRTDEAHALLDATPSTDSVLIALAKARVARKLNQPKQALEAIDGAITPTISPYHKSNLLMYRGRVLEELSLYDEAWEAWVEGNTLHAGKFDIATHVKLVDSIIETPIGSDSQSQSNHPVFIIGMFRSGTTLLEQILGAHPDIDAAGEVNQMLRYVKDKPYPECIEAPNQEWADQYLNRLNSDAKFCTDKMPMNYLHVGLIHTLFPNASIIHITRNPLDTCVSCFANSFSASHAYTSDLHNLAGVYEQYQRIMMYWNKVLPNRIYEIAYESLVDNIEKTIKGVLEHIGVEFNSDVLHFYTNRRIAVTPSADQVRKPIYKSSIDRHKKFESYLGELTRLQ